MKQKEFYVLKEQLEVGLCVMESMKCVLQIWKDHIMA